MIVISHITVGEEYKGENYMKKNLFILLFTALFVSCNIEPISSENEKITSNFTDTNTTSSDDIDITTGTDTMPSTDTGTIIDDDTDTTDKDSVTPIGPSIEGEIPTVIYFYSHRYDMMSHKYEKWKNDFIFTAFKLIGYVIRSEDRDKYTDEYELYICDSFFFAEQSYMEVYSTKEYTKDMALYCPLINESYVTTLFFDTYMAGR